MALLPLASRSRLLFQFSLLLLLCSVRGREVPLSKSKDVDDLDAFDITEQAVDDHVWTYAKQSEVTAADGDAGAPVINQMEEVDDVYRFYDKKPSDQEQVAGRRAKKSDTDPSLHVFFTVRDLRIGNTMPLYFPAKPDPSKSPRLLPREEAESIPFSSSRLDRLLDYFSFSRGSPQAKAMEYTLQQCELEPIEGEVKFCATSLEAMLDRARRIFGPGTETRAMTTTYLSMSSTANPLKNYTILETPEQVPAPLMIGCHPMPYPYAVFYCHCQLRSENRLYRVSLGGPNGERVEATAVCHMDTSKWDADHVSFHVLRIKPRSAPVCHFFPVDNLIWVPGQSDHV